MPNRVLGQVHVCVFRNQGVVSRQRLNNRPRFDIEAEIKFRLTSFYLFNSEMTSNPRLMQLRKWIRQKPRG